MRHEYWAEITKVRPHAYCKTPSVITIASAARSTLRQDTELTAPATGAVVEMGSEEMGSEVADIELSLRRLFQRNCTLERGCHWRGLWLASVFRIAIDSRIAIQRAFQLH